MAAIFTIKDVKANDVVWAKYLNYPFWPSVVDSVQCKKKLGKALTRVKVYFLGVVDDANKPFGIKLGKNISSYNFLNTLKLTDEGRKSLEGKPFAKQFEQSIKEAEQLKKMRTENKISGTPREQIELLVKMRQPYIEDLRPDEKRRSTANLKNEMDESNSNGNDSELPSSSAFGYDISDTQRGLFGNGDSSSDGEWLDQEEEENSQEDEESGLYGFDQIMKYCKKHKDLMVDISNGKVVSELHNVFFDGLRKEKTTMRMTGKFGPANLSDSQQSEVLKYIQEVVKKRFDGLRNFSYAYDVILPEIMARLISETEGCFLKQAWERLS